MFFTRVGTVIAWLTFVAGIYNYGVAAFVVWLSGSDLKANASLSARYLGTEYTGVAFDRGVRYFLIAIGIGIAAEISRSIKRQVENDNLTSR